MLEGARSHRVCDARCRAARGNRCECWCSGRYHGGGGGALERMAADFGLNLTELGERFSMRDPRGPAGSRSARRAPAPRRRRRREPAPGAPRQAELPL